MSTGLFMMLPFFVSRSSAATMEKRRSGIMFTVHRYLISYVPKLILLNRTWAALVIHLVTKRHALVPFSHHSSFRRNSFSLSFPLPKIIFPCGVISGKIFSPVFLMTKYKLHLNCQEQLAAVSSGADNNSDRKT